MGIYLCLITDKASVSSWCTCVRLSWKHRQNQNCWGKRNLINFTRIQIYQSGCSIYLALSAPPTQQSLGFPISPPLCQTLILSDVSNGIFSPGFSFPWFFVCLSCFSYMCWPFGILILWTVYSYSLLFFYWVLCLSSLFFNGLQNVLQRKQSLWVCFYLRWRGLKRMREWKKDFMKSLKVCFGFGLIANLLKQKKKPQTSQCQLITSKMWYYV